MPNKYNCANRRVIIVLQVLQVPHTGLPEYSCWRQSLHKDCQAILAAETDVKNKKYPWVDGSLQRSSKHAFNKALEVMSSKL